MASVPPQRPISLAQSLHEDHDILDGPLTFEEAIANTEGMKVIFLDRAMVVHKPVGSVQIGDLPAKDEIQDSVKKRVQFLDVVLDYEGDLDLKEIETMFLQQRYQDLPAPIKMKGNNVLPYSMQLFILKTGDRKWNIVKHVRFAEGTKVISSAIMSMCTGRPLEIDYQKNFREGSRALQYMLEGLGGFQVRYCKLVPMNASNKPSRETDDIRAGFQFIKANGPTENDDGQFTSWTEEQVNDPNSPLHKWDRGVIKEFLRCQADKGAQAGTIRDWPLTLVDFTPWAINTVFAPILPYLTGHSVIWIGKSEVGKSPASYTLSHLMSAFWLLQEDRTQEVPGFQTASHLDYFRKERGRRTKPRVYDDGNLYREQAASVKAVTEVSGLDRKTMARWNASSYEKGQLCQLCSNPYDRTVEKPMSPGRESDSVTFENFYKLIRPSFHREFDEEDLLAVLKRSCVVVFTDVGIYVRTPGTTRDAIPRTAWPSEDFGLVSPCSRSTFTAYKRGFALPPRPTHQENLQWSLNLLQAALDGEDVPRCCTVLGRKLNGAKYVEEVRPTLAGISASTTYFPEQENEQVQAEPPTKRFRSVKSSSALLQNAAATREELKENTETEGTKEEAAVPPTPVAVKKECVDVEAKFKSIVCWIICKLVSAKIREIIPFSQEDTASISKGAFSRSICQLAKAQINICDPFAQDAIVVLISKGKLAKGRVWSLPVSWMMPSEHDYFVEWKSVKYTREKTSVGPRGVRKDQMKWKRTLPQLLRADEKGIIKMLVADKLLPNWAGKKCPRCSTGTLSKLSDLKGYGLKHRCSARNCRARINPHHLHPLFTECQGPQKQSLQMQAAMLLLKLHRVPQSTIHLLLGQNHKAIEDMDKKICKLRRDFVQRKERDIIFGNGKSWVDIEADEATFDKRDISQTPDLKHLIVKKGETVMWEQWAGVVQRGRPDTLVLHKLTPKLTVKRAPGPGAIRKTEWTTLGTKLLQDRHVILHTDSAKSYKAKISGVLHDRVIHCKKRVKRNGKWIWLAPKYTSIVKHKIPNTKGKYLKTKSGTQIIDRCWRFLKGRLILNQHTRSNSALLRAKLRSAQYEYWFKNSDHWVGCGSL
ncbi:unnamed protein product, partial [Symbiodinium natans]